MASQLTWIVPRRQLVFVERGRGMSSDRGRRCPSSHGRKSELVCFRARARLVRAEKQVKQVPARKEWAAQ